MRATVITARTLAFALLLVPLTASTPPPGALATDDAATPVPLDVSGEARCAGIPGHPNRNAGCELPLSRGVNLAAWLQYVIPSSYLTGEDLTQIRSLGFTFVRVPLNPELLLVGSPGARVLDADKVNHVQRAVQLALDADLAVVIDLHPTESYVQQVLTRERTTREYERFLARFAAGAISDFPTDRVALGLLNEPRDPDGDDRTPFDYAPIQRRLWAAARQGDPDRTLLATGDDWGSIEGLQRIELLPDPNVIYEFHFYTPFLFTHQGATWTWHVVRPIRELPYPASPANIADARALLSDVIRDPRERAEIADHITWYGKEAWDRERIAARIDEAASWADDHGARVFLGEFGAYEDAPGAGRAAWTRDVRESAEARGIGWAYWNWDSDFGLVERATGEVDAALLAALVD